MRLALAVAAVTITLGTAPPACAQGGYEFEVYNTQIAPVRSLMLELHSNYTFRGITVSASPAGGGSGLDGLVPASGTSRTSAAVECARNATPFFEAEPAGRSALSAAYAGANTGAYYAASTCEFATASTSYAAHETLEAVTGVTSWSEVGAYLFTSAQESPAVLVTGGSLRYKARMPISSNWPVGFAVSAEVEYESPPAGASNWGVELRPVIDKAFGRWYVSVNPTLERVVRGAGVPNGVQFSPSAKASFDFTDRLSGGVEYYGAFGNVAGFVAPANRLQQFFGAADLHVSPNWEVNLGVGAGTTPATNHLVGKLIVGRLFSWR